MKIIPASDSSLLVVFGNAISPALHQRVIALFRSLQGQHDRRIRNLHPGYASLLIDFDPLRLTHDELSSMVEQLTSLATLRSASAPTWSPFRSVMTSSSVPICWMSRSMPDFRRKRLSAYILHRRISYIFSDSLQVSFTSVGCQKFCTRLDSRLPGNPLPAEVSGLLALRRGSTPLTLPADGS